MIFSSMIFSSMIAAHIITIGGNRGS